MMHSLMTIRTRVIIDNTPSSLDGVILRRLKLARKYHSGNISKGVAKPLDVYIISRGWLRDTPSIRDKTPRMSRGNIYRISLGHAGSP
jgi:hypothetical protein